MEQEQMHRHFRVEFEDGVTLTLPAETWLDQALVHRLLAEVRGREPGWMSDDDWQAFVWSVVDRSAESEEERA